MNSLFNFVIPPWGKWVAIGTLCFAAWGHGYVKGIQNTNDHAANNTTKIIYKQNKATEKVIVKYIKVKTKQHKIIY